jgi:hypothetical protein
MAIRVCSPLLGKAANDRCNCKKRCDGWFGHDNELRKGCVSLCDTNPNLWSPDDYLKTNVFMGGSQIMTDTLSVKETKPSNTLKYIGAGILVLVVIIVAIVLIKKSKK